MGPVSVIAEAEVRPTEDKDKVSRAITNLFTGALAERREEDRFFLTLEGNGVKALERFRTIIQRDRIRAAVGAVLRKASRENGVTVFLNKQVAFVNHVSFCEPEGESPLGPIRLFIKTDNASKVVSWVTGDASERPRTPNRARQSETDKLDIDTL